MASISGSPQTVIANQTTVPVEQTTVTVNQTTEPIKRSISITTTAKPDYIFSNWKSI